MTRNGNHFWVPLALICTFTALVSAAAALTPAGTQLQTASTARYYSSTGMLMPTTTSNTVTTTVGQIASVNVSPESDMKQADSGTSVDFALTATNAGNGVDAFGLSAVPENGSTVTIYRDDNGDGERQSTETTQVTATGTLPAGGAFKCFATVQLPAGSETVSETVTFTAKSGLDAAKTAQSTLTVQAKPEYTGPYILSWLVNGYYPNSDRATRLSKDYLGGEASAAPLEGTSSGGKMWFRLDSPAEYVDLAKTFGYPIYCAGYAHVYVYSPTPQEVNMWIGSNDGVKIWLNGTAVWTNDILRSFRIDKDRTTVGLSQGWNNLLVKISQDKGSWGFSVRLCDSSGNAIPGLVYAVEPVLPNDKTPPAISDVAITAGTTSALVEWNTDEPASTLVDYGTTTSLGEAYADETLCTHHKAALGDLAAGTTYYLRVGSADAAGNITWHGDYTFQTTAPPTNTNPYILSWLANGHYSDSKRATRLSRDYLGGEGSVIPTEGSVSGGKTWFRLDSSREYVDLNRPFGYPTGCVAYAHAYIYSPGAQKVSLWAGSDDGIKIWLNGSVIWNNDIYRSMTVDQDKMTVNLTAGWNRLLVKVSQGGGGWGFSLKLCDAYGSPVPDLTYAVSP